MEDATLIERLRRESSEFSRLYEDHQHLAHEVDELERAPHLTAEQELELKCLKKFKLKGKDTMTKLVEQQKNRPTSES